MCIVPIALYFHGYFREFLRLRFLFLLYLAQVFFSTRQLPVTIIGASHQFLLYKEEGAQLAKVPALISVALS